jgi:hypothetical protein
MPSSEVVLENLTLIAREAWPIAIAWHIVLAVAVVCLALGWRPRAQYAAISATIPLVSVAAFAWGYASFFNAIVFSAAAALLLMLGHRASRRAVRQAAPVPAAIGALMVAFGAVYPHFLDGASLLIYAYAAPTGLLPCPTLSVVIGLALLGRGFGSRAWSGALAALALFYGLFGAFHLGVMMDLVLVGGALTLLITAFLADALPSHQRQVASHTQ